MPSKKLPAKKTGSKKASAKKSKESKNASKNVSVKKTTKKKSAPQKTSSEKPLTESFDATCKCKQKRNGKFYCFRLQQGRWVQVSGVPFETQEDCEADCCEG